jgi:hypothetical protein
MFSMRIFNKFVAKIHSLLQCALHLVEKRRVRRVRVQCRSGGSRNSESQFRDKEEGEEVGGRM